jgi:DNA-binding protein Fis
MNFNIYVIRSKTQHNKVYIGSTKKTLEQRVKEHLAHYFQYKNGNASYCSSFDIIDTGDIKIELLETTTEDKRFEREGFYIKLFKSVGACVNVKQSGRTQKEWQDQNKDRMRETQKQWRVKNPDYHKNYYKKLKNGGNPVININELSVKIENMVVS